MNGLDYVLRSKLDQANDCFARGERVRAEAILREVAGLLIRQSRMISDPEARERKRARAREILASIADGPPAAGPPEAEFADLLEEGPAEDAAAEPLPEEATTRAELLLEVLLPLFPHEEDVTPGSVLSVLSGEETAPADVLASFSGAVRRSLTRGTESPLAAADFDPDDAGAARDPGRDPIAEILASYPQLSAEEAAGALSEAGGEALTAPDPLALERALVARAGTTGEPEEPSSPPMEDALGTRLRMLGAIHGLSPDAVDLLAARLSGGGLVEQDLEEAVIEERRRQDGRQLIVALREMRPLLTNAEYGSILDRAGEPGARPDALLAEARAIFEERRAERERREIDRWMESARDVLPAAEVGGFAERIEAGEETLLVLGELRRAIQGAAFEKVLWQIIEPEHGEPPSPVTRETPRSLRRKLVRKMIRLHGADDFGLDRERIRERVSLVAGGMLDFGAGARERRRGDTIESVEALVLDVCPEDFDDVAGMDELKRSLELAIENSILRFDEIVRIYGRPPRKTGFVLYGPPGTGKSFFARSVAGEFQRKHGLTVLHVPKEAMFALHHTKRVRRIVDIFRLARERSPAIVIWDEFETFASDPRITGRKYDEVICNMLKEQFEGVEGAREPVFHLATSNYPWQIELPILRPGRLGETVYVGLPDAAARLEIIRMKLPDICPEETLDLPGIVESLGDYTVSEILRIVDHATMERPLADVPEPGRPLRAPTQEDFEAALAAYPSTDHQTWLEEAAYTLGRPKYQAKRKKFPQLVSILERETGPC